MTYCIDKTTAFMKDVARAKRQGLDISKLTATISALATGQSLPRGGARAAVRSCSPRRSAP